MNDYVYYRQSGVDIDQGNKFVGDIAKLIAGSTSSRVISSIGGYNALYDISQLNVKNPVLVSSTDGVGTKLKLAERYNQLAGLGIDLVAMCANDVIVSGAKPLFFLDYYATGGLDRDHGREIISGIIQGCQQADMSLVGGETAEMPALYANSDFDLAGFCLGIVDRDCIITPSRVQEHDVIIGIASSGVHANGYSLINKLLDARALSDQYVDRLLTPTRIYVQEIATLQDQVYLHGAAHITGGGITDNLPRILPHDACAVIDLDESWFMPPIFATIQSSSGITTQEMLQVFNCGVGMIVIVDRRDCDLALGILNQTQSQAWIIGHIIKRIGDCGIMYA